VYNPALPCVNVTHCSGKTYFSATLTSDNICAFADLIFAYDYSIISNASASFTAALRAAIVSYTGDDSSFLQFVLNPGSFVATIQTSNVTFANAILYGAQNGLLVFTWNGLIFQASAGCSPGSAPNAEQICTLCPANTASSDGTLCTPCSTPTPAGSIVCAGAASSSSISTATVLIAVLVSVGGMAILVISALVYLRKRKSATNFDTFKARTTGAAEFSNPLYDSYADTRPQYASGYENPEHVGVIKNPVYAETPGSRAGYDEPTYISASMKTDHSYALANASVPSDNSYALAASGYAEPRYAGLPGGVYVASGELEPDVTA